MLTLNEHQQNLQYLQRAGVRLDADRDELFDVLDYQGTIRSWRVSANKTVALTLETPLGRMTGEVCYPALHTALRRNVQVCGRLVYIALASTMTITLLSCNQWPMDTPPERPKHARPRSWPPRNTRGKTTCRTFDFGNFGIPRGHQLTLIW